MVGRLLPRYTRLSTLAFAEEIATTTMMCGNCFLIPRGSSLTIFRWRTLLGEVLDMEHEMKRMLALGMLIAFLASTPAAAQAESVRLCVHFTRGFNNDRVVLTIYQEAVGQKKIFDDTVTTKSPGVLGLAREICTEIQTDIEYTVESRVNTSSYRHTIKIRNPFWVVVSKHQNGIDFLMTSTKPSYN